MNVQCLKSQVSRLVLPGLLLAGILCLGRFAPVCSGQEVSNVSQVPNELPPADTTSFFQSLGGYFSSINTNYTFTGNTLEVSVGAGQSGPILANYVAAQYDLGRWDIAAQIRNAGLGGVIQSAELGGGYKIISTGDTALTVALLGGYDFDKRAGLIEPQLFIRKKGTKNTYFEAGISLPEWTSGTLNKTPGFFVGTGFTY